MRLFTQQRGGSTVQLLSVAQRATDDGGLGGRKIEKSRRSLTMVFTVASAVFALLSRLCPASALTRQPETGLRPCNSRSGDMTHRGSAPHATRTAAAPPSKYTRSPLPNHLRYAACRVYDNRYQIYHSSSPSIVASVHKCEASRESAPSHRLRPGRAADAQVTECKPREQHALVNASARTNFHR